MTYRILDLFCGAGLVHDGLKSVGFHVTGVDLSPQPAYPGPFLRHDATTLDPRFLDSFDAVWASPPCLKETELHASGRREQRAHGAEVTAHADLISPTQRMLDAWAKRTGGCFVIENVENTRLLRDPVTLCGSMFGLGVTDRGQRFHLERHRKFEANFTLAAPCGCRHQKPVVGCYGGHARVRAASAGGRGSAERWTRPHPEIMAEAMGLSRRLTGAEISQGIPPAYAEYIGLQMMRALRERRRAA